MPNAEGGKNRQLELLEELVAWTRFANREAVIKLIGSVMPDPRHLRAFEATDGKRTQAEVGAFARLTQPTVSGLWARWRRLGLLMDRGERLQHLVRPSDLGMHIPEAGETSAVTAAANAGR